MDMFDEIEIKVKKQLEEMNESWIKTFRPDCKNVWFDGGGTYCKCFPEGKGYANYRRTDCYGKLDNCRYKDKFELKKAG